MNKLNKNNENKLDNIKEYSYPMFVKFHKGKAVVTIKDINELLDLELNSNYNVGLNKKYWNALGNGTLREEFEMINNVKYEDETFFFVYLPGFFKILQTLLCQNRINPLKVRNIIMEFI